MARRPTQKETLRRTKKSLQNEKTIRKRLIPNRNHTRRTKKENRQGTGKQPQNPPTEHKPSECLRPSHKQNTKSRNPKGSSKPSQRRLQPPRRHHQRHNNRNPTRTGTRHITPRPTRISKRHSHA